MRSTRLLHSLFKKSCHSLHQTRMRALMAATQAAIVGQRISINALGQNLQSKTSTKHDIKRMDRLVGNHKLLADKPKIIQTLLQNILPKRASLLPIIVDESSLDSPNTIKLIRFTLVMKSRPITLYEEVFSNGEFKRRAMEFLKSLHEVIPKKHQVVIISDAGFFPTWFKRVESFDWHWLGRASLKYSYQHVNKKAWKYTTDIVTPRNRVPKKIGRVIFSKSQRLIGTLYSYKERLKGGYKKNKLGKKDGSKTSIEKTKSARRAWILVTSLPENQFTAKQIVELYKTRMLIELSFRDLKSGRYGLDFRSCLTKDIGRLNNLLFIAQLATFCLWLLGRTAERNELHRQYQSNSIKNRRVLSYVYLGRLIQKKGCRGIKQRDLWQTLRNLKNAIAGEEDYASVH